MRVLYLFLLAILLAAYWKTWWRLTRSSSGLTPTLGWHVGLVFFVVTPFSILTLNGGFTLPAIWEVERPWASVDLSNPKFLLPYLVVWLSLMLSCFTLYLFSPNGEDLGCAYSPVSIKVVKRTLWGTFVLAVSFWIFSILMAGGIAEFLVSHWYARHEDLLAAYGDGYVLLSHVALCNQVIFVSAAALYTGIAMQIKKANWLVICTIIIDLLGETIVSGNRIHIAVYLLSVFTWCCILERIGLLVKIVVSAPLLVIAFSLWGSIRGNLSELSNRTTAYFDSDRRGNATVTSLMDVTEGMDTLLLLHIVRDFGTDVPYLYGQSYLRAITSLIPRRLYPGKTENFTSVLSDLYLPGEMTSLNATALGEMYANFGPASILLMPILTFGIVRISVWSVRTQRSYPLRPALLFVLIIGVARVTLEDNVVLFVLATLLIWLARFNSMPRPPFVH